MPNYTATMDDTDVTMNQSNVSMIGEESYYYSPVGDIINTKSVPYPIGRADKYPPPKRVSYPVNKSAFGHLKQ